MQRMQQKLVSRSCIALALCLSACASTRVDAEWKEPQFHGSSLAGARVYVGCQANEPVLAQLCKDRVAAELRARGATALVAEAGRVDAATAARDSGASASLLLQISAVEARAGTPFSIGIGGFGVGSGGFGGGIGVGVPLGGGPTELGYAADGTLTDIASGRVMWSGRARAGASGNLNAQVEDLARTLVERVQQAGFL